MNRLTLTGDVTAVLTEVRVSHAKGEEVMQVQDDAYQGHPVFNELKAYADFYRRLSTSVFHFPTMGTTAIANIDTYVFSSMQGTLESMINILLTGRINDAYCLLRKYYDSTIINIYSNLYLSNHFSIENFIVAKINDWLHGKEKMPDYRAMSQYVRASDRLKPIRDVLEVDDRYKRIRGRCNDHTHYNFFQYAMLNDNEVHLPSRGKWLSQLAVDAQDILILHLGYLFLLHPHYMMSSDHMDHIECNMPPPEDSQYWVAPFVQKALDQYVSPRRADVITVLKTNTPMHLS